MSAIAKILGVKGPLVCRLDASRQILDALDEFGTTNDNTIKADSTDNILLLDRQDALDGIAFLNYIVDGPRPSFPAFEIISTEDGDSVRRLKEININGMKDMLNSLEELTVKGWSIEKNHTGKAAPLYYKGFYDQTTAVTRIKIIEQVSDLLGIETTAPQYMADPTGTVSKELPTDDRQYILTLNEDQLQKLLGDKPINEAIQR